MYAVPNISLPHWCLPQLRTLTISPICSIARMAYLICALERFRSIYQGSASPTACRSNTIPKPTFQSGKSCFWSGLGGIGIWLIISRWLRVIRSRGIFLRNAYFTSMAPHGAARALLQKPFWPCWAKSHLRSRLILARSPWIAPTMHRTLILLL